MTQWWQELSGTQQVFWSIAIFFTTLLLIQFAISFFGGDLDGDGDGDTFDGHGMDSDFAIFSFRSVIAFFTFFGWGGVLVLGEGGSIWLALAVAVAAGFAAMFMVAYMMYWFSKLTQEGNIDMSAALLSTGEVYLTIPAGQAGVGKVHLHIGNTVRELDAVTKGDTLVTGSKIRVLDLAENNIVIVESIDKPSTTN